MRWSVISSARYCAQVMVNSGWWPYRAPAPSDWAARRQTRGQRCGGDAGAPRIGAQGHQERLETARRRADRGQRSRQQQSSIQHAACLPRQAGAEAIGIVSPRSSVIRKRSVLHEAISLFQFTENLQWFALASFCNDTSAQPRVRPRFPDPASDGHFPTSNSRGAWLIGSQPVSVMIAVSPSDMLSPVSLLSRIMCRKNTMFGASTCELPA